MDSVIIASIVNFGAVVGILYFGARKPFVQMLQDRSETVKKSMDEATALSSEAQSSLSKWEHNWRERENSIRQQIADAQAALKVQKEKTIASAKHEAERIQRDAELMGASEVTRAKRTLQEELVEKSVNMAANYLGKSLSAKDKQKLVVEYVDMVRANGTR
jgi:F0F1-type ATP synthase membrane subunit b/b'